ncbi:MAG: transcription antitermination factor NusB [Candidatus Caenarcaniphilales bacterium]|jgi:N utilization substance protein B|nr:transcription antitermination factor NusB [Candidatus Caenarcaniphilales bacterium]
MEKRSAAREMAFLVLFQLPQKTDRVDITKLSKMDFHAICLSAIRTLADHSSSNLKKAESFLLKTERHLMEYQVNHPDNEMLTEASRSVALPTSQDFLEQINNCYQAINLLKEALQIPETYWHYQDTDIQEFTLSLVIKYVDHKEQIQQLIRELSANWDIDRMNKVDRKIIEIAVAEITQTDIAPAVAVSEAVKLANKYSTPEGVKFINGVLADVVKTVSSPDYSL